MRSRIERILLICAELLDDLTIARDIGVCKAVAVVDPFAVALLVALVPIFELSEGIVISVRAAVHAADIVIEIRGQQREAVTGAHTDIAYGRRLDRRFVDDLDDKRHHVVGICVVAVAELELESELALILGYLYAARFFEDGRAPVDFEVNAVVCRLSFVRDGAIDYLARIGHHSHYNVARARTHVRQARLTVYRLLVGRVMRIAARDVGKRRFEIVLRLERELVVIPALFIACTQELLFCRKLLVSALNDIDIGVVDEVVKVDRRACLARRTAYRVDMLAVFVSVFKRRFRIGYGYAKLDRNERRLFDARAAIVVYQHFQRITRRFYRCGIGLERRFKSARRVYLFYDSAVRRKVGIGITVNAYSAELGHGKRRIGCFEFVDDVGVRDLVDERFAVGGYVQYPSAL